MHHFIGCSFALQLFQLAQYSRSIFEIFCIASHIQSYCSFVIFERLSIAVHFEEAVTANVEVFRRRLLLDLLNHFSVLLQRAGEVSSVEVGMSQSMIGLIFERLALNGILVILDGLVELLQKQKASAPYNMVLRVARLQRNRFSEVFDCLRRI